MKMKFIADIHISYLTVLELQASGYQIDKITRYIAADANDLEIIQLALREQAIIVTQDLDFSSLIAQSGLGRPSIISLRIGNAKPSVVSKLLKEVIPLIEKALIDGAIVSVDENSFRIRKLPINPMNLTIPDNDR